MSFDPNDPALQAFIQNMIGAALQQQAQMFQAQIASLQSQQAAQPVVQTPEKVASGNPNTDPCPDVNDITLVQATLIDNGTKDVREKYEKEFKMCLEVWTGAPDDINLAQIDWKRNVVLVEYYAVSKRIDQWLARGSISQEYYKTLGEVWKMSSTSHWFGLLGDKGDKKGNGPKGTRYYDHQFICVEMKDRIPVYLELCLPGYAIAASNFVPADLKGNPLKGRYTHQARIDLSGEYYTNWPTEPKKGGK